MKNITTKTLVLLTTLTSPFVLAQGGGSLGGSPSVETGAVNVSVGKFTHESSPKRRQTGLVSCDT